MRGIDFILKRTGFALITVFVAETINFVLFRALPGDAITNLSKVPGATPALRAELTKDFGLDKSKWAQYWVYLRQLATGNLGALARLPAPWSTGAAARVRAPSGGGDGAVLEGTTLQLGSFCTASTPAVESVSLPGYDAAHASFATPFPQPPQGGAQPEAGTTADEPPQELPFQYGVPTVMRQPAWWLGPTIPEDESVRGSRISDS